MYLKTIEVQGFKSFVNKTVFQFHNGITAIVGPNGSGKSNVADAVRWVLGEQSARSLRGSNMQDVIFAGTETRRPLSFASVALTLDNADHYLPVDYDEVTVTRRVYRSGESEYILNGTQVRLRDINELFYDTGIGKEGYSIIGQGQIDKILSTKPEDRRELFDEAAGIVKFKRRKNTTVKKLEGEQQNLTRINDILSEITRELGPLEKQAETAKIYLQKREELKTYDVNLFLLETEKTEKDLSNITEKQRIAGEQLNEARAEYDRTKVRYEQAEQEIGQLDASLQEKRDALTSGQLHRQQYASQIDLLKEQIRTARTSDEHLSGRITAIEEQLDDCEAQELQAMTDRETWRAQTAEVSEAYEKQQEITDQIREECSSLNRSIEENKSAIIELLNARASVKARMQRYDTMSEQAKIRKSQLSQEALRLKSEEESQQLSLQDVQDEYEKINARIDALKKETEETEAKLSLAQEELAGDNRRQEEDNTAYHRESSRLESLKNIAERYDGYGSSIRRVMERRSFEPGILGVVADLIHVDQKYETAIETALGSGIQNIVTDTEETAKRQIEFLKKNRYGRATFLPLSGISARGGFSTPQALKEKGVIGLASELVQTKDEYRKLAESLLGRTVVAENIDAAIALAGKYRHSLRIVTLEGELLSPGGSISGGAFKNAGNLLGRRREIEELEAKVKKSREALDLLEEKICSTRKERNRLRDEERRLNKELQSAYLEQNTAKLRLDDLQARAGSTTDSHKKLQDEQAEIEQQEQSIAENLEHEKEELTQSEREEKLMEDQISRMQEKLDAKRKEESDASAALQEMRLQISKNEQQFSFLEQNLERIRADKQRLLTEREQMEAQAKDTAGTVSEKQEEIAGIEKILADAEESGKKLQEEIENLTGRREEISRSNRQFFQSREELSEEISRLDRETFRLNAKAEKITEQRDSQINYMWEEYGLTFTTAKELRDSSYTTVTSLRKNIASVKSEIKALGDVNVNAIEDFKELSGRHEFLSSQQKDLQEAEAKLTKIIGELDDGMRRQFKEQFALIQKEFDKTFRQLFGGGHGSLELVENEDLLDAGIRIIAQPPGKKLQNMMQLSGGEKAMTAIALLFAIQNLKPSPFCLLDEIETALDETNVDRFAHYLRKLTKNTQFIIITHRRGAMNAADRLYGITMQEKGVSALVSVNLVEPELDQ